MVELDEFIKYIENNLLEPEYNENDLDYGDWDSCVEVKTLIDYYSYGIVSKENIELCY